MELNRRDFLKLIGATTVATSLPGCSAKEPRNLIPYIIPHEEIIPGRSVWYASVCRECPAGCGLSVRVREGRPTKLEGNPLHPVNRGALCARGQAALQELYNPDRLQAPMKRTPGGAWEQMKWDDVETLIVSSMKEIARQRKGKPVWVSGQTTGTQKELLGEWLEIQGSDRLLLYEPLAHDSMKKGNEVSFNIPVIPSFDFAAARSILSFGTDFLETWISPVEFARGFSARRGGDLLERNHFVYFGPRLSLTAANADQRFSVRPEYFAPLALSMVHVIVHEGNSGHLRTDERERILAWIADFSPERVGASCGIPPQTIVALAKDFAQASPGLALAGGVGVDGDLGVGTIAAVNLLNYVCGNIGKTVLLHRPHSTTGLSSNANMQDLIKEMNAGNVPALFLSETNPVYSLPNGNAFAEAMKKVPFVVSFVICPHETSSHANIVLPLHTPLESWGDYSPCAGVQGLLQPVTQPLYDSKMLGDVLLATGKQLGGGETFQSASYLDLVKRRWAESQDCLGSMEPFMSSWVSGLARGGTWCDLVPVPVKLSASLGDIVKKVPIAPKINDEDLTLFLSPSMSLYDGRGANKPWLQELPDPMTRLTWGSWAEFNPEDARRLGLANGDLVSLESSEGKAEFAIYNNPGIHRGIVAASLGQGHTSYGRYANARGANAIALAGSSEDAIWSGTRITVRKTGRRLPIPSVQTHGTEHGRNLIQHTIASEPEHHTEAASHESGAMLYPGQSYPLHRWGMVIDLDKCTGCGACVTACYAENNVPVAGADEVAHGRHMAWLRVDRYYENVEEGTPGASFMPMLCQHCGNAPCETVCPVYAAYHTTEGLNGQVYNRCIGTRYCANNCPYKVRRFNWFDHEIASPLNWQLNPDVTVRTKGVMEKCTFCIQRIVEGKNNARIAGRQLEEDEIKTACQQTCPSRAITFGDLKQNNSLVLRLARGDFGRAYQALEELNTQSAVTYLKKVDVKRYGV